MFAPCLLDIEIGGLGIRPVARSAAAKMSKALACGQFMLSEQSPLEIAVGVAHHRQRTVLDVR